MMLGQHFSLHCLQSVSVTAAQQAGPYHVFPQFFVFFSGKSKKMQTSGRVT